MGLLDKLWDDVVAGPQPDRGLSKLRKNSKDIVVDSTSLDADQANRSMRSPLTRSATQSIYIQPPPLIRSASINEENMASTPTGSSPGSPASLSSPGSTRSIEREKVWRMYHPGSSGRAGTMQRQGSARFDTAAPNSPSVYDWMYSSESRNKWQ